MTEWERCDEEIRQIEDLLRGGHPDVDGLLLALNDWRAERRLIPQIRSESGDQDGSARNEGENRHDRAGKAL